MTAPVVVGLGWTVNVNFAAGPGLTLNGWLYVPDTAVAEAKRVYAVPALSMVRSLNDATIAVAHAAGFSVVDRVVFGEPGDLMLLGSRTLEGLNLMVDPDR